MAASPQWALSITRTTQVPPGELTPHPLNWRLHPVFQRQALDGLLDQVGWVDDVLVNETTGHILDGHLRVELALERGEPLVPVTYVRLTPEQEVQVLTTLDPIAALAVVDRDRLADLTRDLTAPTEHTQALLDLLLAPPDEGTAETKRSIQQKAPTEMLAFRVAIGPYRFEVDLTTYTGWVNALYETCNHDADAALAEVSRRLGLEGV